MNHVTSKQLAGCMGKKVFLTYSRAQQAAERSRRSKMHDGDVLVVYRCRYCSRFHVGSHLRGAA